MQPLANGKALVEEYERVQRVVRTFEIDLDKPRLRGARHLHPQ